MGPRGAGIRRAIVLAEGRVLVWASRAASRRPPFKEGIRERESSPLCSVSVSLGISGTSPSPSLSPEAVPSEVFLPPRSTVFTVSSSPDTCAGAAAETALREELPLRVPWPQAVSAAKAPKLASNTRERIKAIIFMNLRKCVKCTGRNQRLFALALTPELLRPFPGRICQTKCGMPPQAPGCTRGNWHPGTRSPHAGRFLRECASTAAFWLR